MSLDRSRNYLVLNYNSSPVVIETRYESTVIPGGTREEPSSLPLSIDEILQVNNNSPFFKCGILFFEEEFAEELYNECRIKNWQSILTDEQIEDIILHPTIESLQIIVDIQTEVYFERCYGIYIGLMNANYSVPANVVKLMKIRRGEFRRKKYKSEISLTPKDVAPSVSSEELNETKAQVNELTATVKAQQEQIAQLLAALQQKETKAPKAPATTTKRRTTKPKETDEEK